MRRAPEELDRARRRARDDLEDIRRDSRSALNRLLSIQEDAAFVNDVIHQMLPHLPLVGNERCGTWYIYPRNRHKDSVYFKSTDGHTGVWDFSLRRSNLHLLDTVAKHGGCIIVDSTRRGKRMPDSLSKTIPIWCATVNRAVKFYVCRANKETQHPASSADWDSEFHSLSSCVPMTEHAQIAARIDGFAETLLSSGADIAALASKLRKPLRPIWFTPKSRIFVDIPPCYDNCGFWPVICVSASTAVPAGAERRGAYLYVQGAADDHELWSHGLTPSLFWSHKDEMLSGTAAACEAAVRRIVASARESRNDGKAGREFDRDGFKWIGDTGIAVGSKASGCPPQCWEHFDAVINCCAEFEYPENASERRRDAYLNLRIPEGKKGQVRFGDAIGPALEFLRRQLAGGGSPRKVLIHCMQGIDRSVGIALAFLVRYVDDAGRVDFDAPLAHVTKELVRRRLLYLTSYQTAASPSRATLQRVNVYFMGARS